MPQWQAWTTSTKEWELIWTSYCDARYGITTAFQFCSHFTGASALKKKISYNVVSSPLMICLFMNAEKICCSVYAFLSSFFSVCLFYKSVRVKFIRLVKTCHEFMSLRFMLGAPFSRNSLTIPTAPLTFLLFASSIFFTKKPLYGIKKLWRPVCQENCSISPRIIFLQLTILAILAASEEF